MTTSWRMFCAVELPPEVRTQLEDHIAKLRKEIPDAPASWSRVENIHLTLKFFGNVGVDRIAEISGAITRAVKDFSSFEISVGKTGAFRTQVLWIGVSDPSEKLSALHKRIEDECAVAGFEKEDRAYRPHLTIARIRKPHGARRLADTHLKMKFETIAVHVRELVVFRSELSSKGSKYTAISSHGLDR
ncbi:MAG TPA: RNA 2',3'-cyclic phosphodiesterase [Pyrinomonadaceae bacterium]|jgi:2'-5' RNA ligase|nr:RNA 2',3'-cyclic phosphodiesterase [Pyrinomonadaceae bacterium]